MKTVTVVLSALAFASVVEGATITLNFDGVTPSGNRLVTFAVDYEAGERIDIFDFTVNANPGTSLVQAETNPFVINLFEDGNDDTDFLASGTFAFGATTRLNPVDSLTELSASVGGPPGTPYTDLVPSGVPFAQVVLDGNRWTHIDVDVRFVAAGELVGRFLAIGSFEPLPRIPEPSTVTLGVLALVSLAGYARRRQQSIVR